MASRSLNRTRWIAFPALLLIAVASGLLLERLGGLEAFERAMLDLQYRAHLDEGTDPRIIIVAVDQPSLDYFEQDNIPFPWPRSLYNPIVDYLTRHGAKAILFDILFTDETSFGPAVDQEFGAAIGASGRTFLAAASGGDGKTPLPIGLPLEGDPPAAIRRAAITPPLSPLFEQAAGIGLVSQQPDADGIYRRVMPFFQMEQRAIPALGIAGLMQPDRTVEWDRENRIRHGDLSLKTNAEGKVLLRFRHREPYRRVSTLDVIHSEMREQAGEAPVLDGELFR